MSQQPTPKVLSMDEHQSASAPPALPDSSPEPRSRSTGTLLRWLVAIVIVVGAIVTLRLTVLAPKPVKVDAVRATVGSVEETVTNTRAGTVTARLRAGISPQTGGRVVELPHREGERVRAGDLLLRVDDSLQRAQLELAMEDVRAAEARAEEACLAADLATSELARFVELRARGIASDQVLDSLTSERDRSLAACRAGRAVHAQARAQERLARAGLALTTVHAPFDGVIAEVNTEIGEWITPSPTGLAMPSVIDLLDPGSLYVAAPIDEMDAARVRVGQDVRITVDSCRDEVFDGRLVRVAPYVLDLVEQNRTVEIEAELAEPRVVERLLAGTSADVEVILDSRADVLTVPTGAIAQGDRILVVVDGRLEERTVTTGLGNWRRTEITSGLSEGELVVTARSRPEIVAGALVEIQENR